jgi:hypothetical protein
MDIQLTKAKPAIMKTSNLIYGFSAVLIFCGLNLSAAENSLEASAESSASIEDRIGKVISSGKVNLDTRLRYEHADSTNAGIKPANALTFRTRLGYTTDSWNGLKGMVEFENITALGGDDQYRDAPGPAANLV